MLIYTRPLLPKMHYMKPFSIMQQDMLRHQAVNIVAARLSRSEPPLRKEVVEYMSDIDSHLWSMRRSKANFSRLMSVFSGLIAVGKWIGEVCLWKNCFSNFLKQHKTRNFFLTSLHIISFCAIILQVEFVGVLRSVPLRRNEIRSILGDDCPLSSVQVEGSNSS